MRPNIAHLPLLLTAALAACSSMESKKIDYKSDSKQQARPLEIPPDLSSPNTSDRYSVPDTNTATFSGTQAVKAGAAEAAPLAPQKAYVERAGSQRWLVVQGSSQQLWQVLKDFWQENGFIIVSENTETGIMETDWAENRAKIPQGFIRSMIGKVFDEAYTSPERDKFRTRLERGLKPGTTEVYVSHRGMFEVYVNDANMRQTGRTIWQPRPSDPELEAEMLKRLQVKLNGDQPVQTAQGKSVTAPGTQEPRAVVAKAADGVPVLKLKDDFDRAWRRVGLSLDRLGFAVQDRDRSNGLYYVKYLNPDGDAKKPGLLSRLAFWESDPPKKAADYRILVADAHTGTDVKVEGLDGKPEKSDAASRILTVLQEDLK